MRYRVIFTQYWDYEVEAEDEYEAEQVAKKEFLSDMHYPVAHTNYDDIDIEELEDE